MIIDFHTHTFPDAIATRAIHKLAAQAHTTPNCDGTNNGLLSHMQQCGIDISVIVPIATKPEQTFGINERAFRINESESHLISFGSIHPDNDNYKEVLKNLKSHNIKGIKLHPAYQGTYFDDIRFMRIISYAQELGLYVLTHAGMDAGLPKCDFASVSHIIETLDKLDQSKLILAHMGGYGEWDIVEKEIVGSDVFFDTSYSHLPTEQFVRIVNNHGAKHILFGTDSPWTNQKTEVDNIRSSGLAATDIDSILFKNASTILGDAIKL